MRGAWSMTPGLQIILLLLVAVLCYLLWRRERSKISALHSNIKKDLTLTGEGKFTLEDIIRESNHKSYHLYFLFNASKTLNSTLDLNHLVKIINDIFVEVINSQGGCLFVPGEDRNTYRMASSKPLEEAPEFTVSSEALEFFAQKKEALSVNELRMTGGIFSEALRDFCDLIPIQTCIPLVYNNQVLALQFLMPKTSQEILTSTEKELLSTLAGLAANALQNSVLYDMSIYDGLTKIHNYRYFRQRLIEELRRSQRYNEALSLIMFDLDDFKKFNDTYGHLKGDEVLYDLAQLVANAIRKDIDIAARYGGEEFAVILPETNYNDALTVADRLRLMVEKYAFKGSNSKKVHITISLGVAGIPQSQVENFQELVGLADKALYKAKKQGKNQVCGVK